jgi:polyisoprenoid-binding protein YceI
MKKLSIILLVAIATFFSSFVGIYDASQNPGSITFTTDAGMKSDFTVGRWKFKQCDIQADAIEKLKVEAEMDMSSLDCSWRDLEKNVKKKKDYFYVKNFPTATLRVDGAKKVSDNEYTAVATLTLRDIARPITLTFNTITEGKSLKIKGIGTVNRRDHEFTGDGPKDLVPVSFEFEVK